ncbi:hypothetical protein ACJX0J_008347, partial [Zea mays]
TFSRPKLFHQKLMICGGGGGGGLPYSKKYKNTCIEGTITDIWTLLAAGATWQTET